MCNIHIYPKYLLCGLLNNLTPSQQFINSFDMPCRVAGSLLHQLKQAKINGDQDPTEMETQ